MAVALATLYQGVRSPSDGVHPDLELARAEHAAGARSEAVARPTLSQLFRAYPPTLRPNVELARAERAGMQLALLRGQVDPLTHHFGSNDARVLCEALALYYSRHEPSRVATVVALVARVYGGPPCSINGISIHHALWTAKELCEQLRAIYGETVPVKFKTDGSLDIRATFALCRSMSLASHSAPPEAQETRLDPEWIAAREASLDTQLDPEWVAAREASLETQLDADWIAAREASLVEAKRMAERGSLEEAAVEQALALSLAQHQEAAKPGPSSLGAEVAALEAEIAALQAGHTMDQMQELPVQDSSAVPFGLPVVPQAGPSSTSGVIQHGELQIGNKLGSGAFGVVYKALWKGDVVAVKQVRSDRLENREGAKEDFRKELDLMLSLRHRHIVNCYGGSCDPELVLVMELMERGSLRDCLRDRPQEFAWAQLGQKILCDAAKGLVYLHSFSPPIAHFDIKPLNVLISADNTGKLADVGLTRQMMATVTMPQGWTPNYAAPEVLQRLGANEKADIYSFGPCPCPSNPHVCACMTCARHR